MLHLVILKFLAINKNIIKFLILSYSFHSTNCEILSGCNSFEGTSKCLLFRI